MYHKIAGDVASPALFAVPIFMPISTSPMAKEIGHWILSQSSGNFLLGWVVKPPSTKLSCWQGRMVYWAPQQKQADPIFNSLVSWSLRNSCDSWKSLALWSMSCWILEKELHPQWNGRALVGFMKMVVKVDGEGPRKAIHYLHCWSFGMNTKSRG